MGAALLAFIGCALASSVAVWGAPSILLWLGMVAVAGTFAFPRVAFYVLLLLMPLDLHLGDGLVNALMDPARFLVGISFGLRFRNTWELKARKSIVLLTIGYLFAAILSLVIAASLLHLDVPVNSYRSVYKLTSYVVFAACAAVTLRRERDLERVYWLLVIGLVFSCGYEFVQVKIGGFGPLYTWMYPATAKLPWAGRPTGFLNYANSAAAYINLLLPIVGSVGLFSNAVRTRVLSGTALIVALVALVLTESRAGWVSAALILSIVLLRYAPRLLRLPAAVLAMSVATVLVIFVPFISERIQNVELASSHGREVLWGAAWSLFLSSPASGVGYGSFGSRDPQDFVLAGFGGDSTPYHAHNIYLNALAETGAVGLLLLLALLIVVTRVSWKSHVLAMRSGSRLTAGLGLGVAMAMIGVMIHGLLDVPFAVSSQFNTLFWLFVGIAATPQAASRLSEPVRGLLRSGGVALHRAPTQVATLQRPND